MPDGFSKPSGRPAVTGAGLMANPDIRNFMQVQPPQAPPAPTAAVAAPTPPAAAVSQTDLEDVSVEVETAAEAPPVPVKSPKERYLDELKRVGVSLDEAAKVIDLMISQGYYEETVPVTKRLSVVFRTRKPEAADKLNLELNRQHPEFSGTFYALVARYNLAASLVNYGGVKLDPSTDEGFQASLNYIKQNIPGPIYQVLVTKLSKFDDKLSVVTSEEGLENFF